jgi:hypothetical protein
VASVTKWVAIDQNRGDILEFWARFKGTVGKLLGAVGKYFLLLLLFFLLIKILRIVEIVLVFGIIFLVKVVNIVMREWGRLELHKCALLWVVTMLKIRVVGPRKIRAAGLRKIRVNRRRKSRDAGRRKIRVNGRRKIQDAGWRELNVAGRRELHIAGRRELHVAVRRELHVARRQQLVVGGLVPPDNDAFRKAISGKNRLFFRLSLLVLFMGATVRLVAVRISWWGGGSFSSSLSPVNEYVSASEVLKT